MVKIWLLVDISVCYFRKHGTCSRVTFKEGALNLSMHIKSTNILIEKVSLESFVIPVIRVIRTHGIHSRRASSNVMCYFVRELVVKSTSTKNCVISSTIPVS